MAHDGVILGEKNGPVWKDGCEHPKESYISSFEEMGKKYDVYVFPNPSWSCGQEVCIRFGSEGSEYFSPGPVDEFVERAHVSDVYRFALRIIRKYGTFTYTRKERS